MKYEEFTTLIWEVCCQKDGGRTFKLYHASEKQMLPFKRPKFYPVLKAREIAATVYPNEE